MAGATNARGRSSTDDTARWSRSTQSSRTTRSSRLRPLSPRASTGPWEAGLTAVANGCTIEHRYDSSLEYRMITTTQTQMIAPTASLDDRIATACGHLNAYYAALVELIREVITTEASHDLGIRSVEQWITWRTGLSASHADTLLVVAEAGDTHPLVAEAFGAGELSVDLAVCRRPDRDHHLGRLHLAGNRRDRRRGVPRRRRPDHRHRHPRRPNRRPSSRPAAAIPPPTWRAITALGGSVQSAAAGRQLTRTW